LGIALAHRNEHAATAQTSAALDAGVARAETLDTVRISAIMAGARAACAGELVVRILGSPKERVALKSRNRDYGINGAAIDIDSETGIAEAAIAAENAALN